MLKAILKFAGSWRLLAEIAERENGVFQTIALERETGAARSLGAHPPRRCTITIRKSEPDDLPPFEVELVNGGFPILHMNCHCKGHAKQMIIIRIAETINSWRCPPWIPHGWQPRGERVFQSSFGSRPPMGTRSSTVVPDRGEPRISSSPPMAKARSCIPRSPKLLERPSAS